MNLTNHPQRGEYFPATKRGHGSRHPYQKTRAGVVLRNANPCVDPTCACNGRTSKNLHIDQMANMREWCDERGLSVRSKDRPHAKYYTPLEAIYVATGGAR